MQNRPTPIGLRFTGKTGPLRLVLRKASSSLLFFYVGIWAVFFLLPVKTTLAQSRLFSIYDFDDKLSKDLIKDIETDKYGFVWTATDQGVVRFDGQQSQFFKDEIPGGYAKALLQTTDGRLLVLHDFGLTEVSIKKDSLLFTSVLQGLPDDSDTVLHYPKTIFQDSQGQVWIGENQSVVAVRPEGVKKFRFGNNQNLGVVTRSFSFAEDQQGQFWVMSNSGFLFKYDREKDLFSEQALSQKLTEVNFLICQPNGRFWVGAKTGVYEMDIKPGQQPAALVEMSGPTTVSCALFVKELGLFVGTWNNGLYFQPANKTSAAFRKINDLPFQDIVGLHADEKNGIWVTGHEQTALLKSVYFQNYNLGTNNRPSITSLVRSSDGSLLLIGDENEINKQEIYQLKDGQVSWKLGLPVNPFDNIPLAAFDGGKNIWVGDLNGNVYFVEKENKNPVKIASIKRSNSSISSFAKDKNQNIWVAGNVNHGIIKISPDLETTFYKDKGLINAKVVYTAPDGQLFVGGIGADNYLFKYDENNDSFENISVGTKIDLNENFEVKDMLQRLDGTMYLATTDGVFLLTKKTENDLAIERFNLNKVPMSEPSNALAFSPDDNLWIATTSGLLAVEQSSSFLFSKSSGLPANSFTNRGLIYDENGNLWVGTANGLSFFHHARSDFPTTPTPLIRSVKANNDLSVPDEDTQPLFPFNTGIEINFLSLSFPAEQVAYRTRLLEVDTTWEVLGTKNQSYLSGLQPGKYTFQVAAQQQEGMRWSKPATFSFEIEKPWFQKPWVLFLMAGLLFVLITVAARLYNLRLIQQKKNLERIIKKRTEEINQQKNEIIEQQKQLLAQNESMRKLKEEQYRVDLENKNKQLTTYTLNLIQKNQALKELQLEINQVIRSSSKSSYQEMRKLLNLIDYSFRKDEDWDNFKLFFEEVYVGFFAKLVQRHPRLTSQDLRHCALIRLNLTIEEIATIIGISADSIKTARFRLKKKMELDSKVDLLEYLMSV